MQTHLFDGHFELLNCFIKTGGLIIDKKREIQWLRRAKCEFVML